jgi:predicted nucleic acid-binding protein
MYLVDTSVWVDFIQRRDTATTLFLADLLENPIAVGINDLIYMEVLQGARGQRAFDTLQAYFSGQRFYDFKDSRDAHEAAARIYFRARREGITLRSSLDCIVAQSAIENDLILLHHDRDYVRMESLVPHLKQKHFL